MHLSIKLSHVILMNMKFKSQPSEKKVERERARLVGGESEVKRKRKSLHREEKFCCFFYLYSTSLGTKEGSKWTANS